MPTTSERRPISRLTRSSGFVRPQLGPVRGGEAVEREQVVLGVLEQLGDLRRAARSRSMTVADSARAPARWSAALKTSRSAAETIAALRGAAVAVHVADEVHGAALPRARRAPGRSRPSAPRGASETHSRTPARPRSRSERRNSTQNASVSTSPMSRPITSRRPALVHRVGDHQRLRAARGRGRGP